MPITVYGSQWYDVPNILLQQLVGGNQQQPAAPVNKQPQSLATCPQMQSVSNVSSYGQQNNQRNLQPTHQSMFGQYQQQQMMQPQQPVNLTVPININNYQNQHTNQANSTATNTTVDQTNNNNPGLQYRPPITIFDVYESFVSGLARRSHYIGLGIVGSIYGGLWYKVRKAYLLMNSRLSWGRWKPELKFAELFALPQEKLCDDLAFEIARRYTSTKEPQELSSMLVLFFNAIHAERAVMHHFLFLAGVLEKLKLSWLFLMTDKKIKRAKAHLKRINFLKNTVVSRIAQHTYLNIIPRTDKKYANFFMVTNHYADKKKRPKVSRIYDMLLRSGLQKSVF